MPQFDSGAAKQIGRFTEGLLLRLLQSNLSSIMLLTHRDNLGALQSPFVMEPPVEHLEEIQHHVS
jgi:hypothetical protein